MPQLLKISEPSNLRSEAVKVSVGIDFGTTNSLIASIQDGFPKVIPDSNGRYLLPSVVNYSENEEITIGYDAKSLEIFDPLNTFFSVKRILTQPKEKFDQSSSPYKFSNDSSGSVRLHTAQGIFTPTEISSQIFLGLRKRAELVLKTKISGAVVTVPAYFDEKQRQAIRDSAQLAGLNVIRLLNEPTAAAIAYGLNKTGLNGVYAVYDLGGGTFDISILDIKDGIFEVLATNGDPALGGDDFDCAIADFFSQLHSDCSFSLLDRRALLLAAKRLRENLSNASSANVQLNLTEDRTLNLSLNQNDFEVISSKLVKKTLDCTQLALADVGLDFQDIQNIIMVGGATRMPFIQKSVANLFGTAPMLDVDPDQVVAIGAALQADLLIGNKTDSQKCWTLLDVTPLSLGIETMGGFVEHIIPRNTTLPATRSQEFTTFKDGQTVIYIHVLQGERESVQDCRSLGKFELRNIPPMKAGVARVRVTFQIDTDGILKVFAEEITTGEKFGISIRSSSESSFSKIEGDMLSDSHKYFDADFKMSTLLEEKIRLKKIINSLRDALKLDAYLLNSREYKDIESCLDQAESMKNIQEIDAFLENIYSISKMSGSFQSLKISKNIRSIRHIDN